MKSSLGINCCLGLVFLYAFLLQNAICSPVLEPDCESNKTFNCIPDSPPQRLNEPTEGFFNEIEQIHSRYAFASYCISIAQKYEWNCGSICSQEANSTVLDYVYIDPHFDQVVHITHNHELKSMYVSFRGSRTLMNFKTDMKLSLSNLDWNGKESAKMPRLIPKTAKVHLGFEMVYSEMRLKILRELYPLTLKYPDYRVIFTGHSLGGSLSILAAVDFFDQHGMQDRISVITYGQPRTGDQTWCNYVNMLPFSSRYFRVVKVGDPVPLMPGRALGYASCGTLVEYSDSGVKICSEGDVDTCKTTYVYVRRRDHSWYRNWIGKCPKR